MWKKLSRIACVFLMAMLLWSVCATALAVDPFEVPKDGMTLTIYFGTKSTPTEYIKGIKMRMYRVADMVDGFATFKYTDSFAPLASRYDLNDMDADDWKAAAPEMAAFAEKLAIRHKVLEAKTGAIKIVDDKNSNKPEDRVTPGLYLLVFDRYIGDTRYFDMEPQLVALPSHPIENGVQNKEVWVYDVVINKKVEDNDRTDLLDVTVYKEWDDKGWAASSRPANITITLYADGKKHDTITLPQTKDGKKIWNYTWTKLNPDITWTVKETKPANYTPQYSPANGKLKKVTSTKYESTITNYRPPKSTDSTLPQTGLNWWPVAVLAVAGMVLVFLGWLARRADEESEEA